MKRILLTIILISGLATWLTAQEDAPKLIISELYMYHSEEAYCELTNMDDHPVDLSRVILSVANNNADFRDSDTSRWHTQMLTHAGYLEPGESFVVMNWRHYSQDSTDIWTPRWYWDHADYWLWYNQRPLGATALHLSRGDDALGLFYDNGDRDVDFDQDTLLDQLGFPDERLTFDVAGVANASVTHLFVRKANVRGMPEIGLPVQELVQRIQNGLRYLMIPGNWERYSPPWEDMVPGGTGSFHR